MIFFFITYPLKKIIQNNNIIKLLKVSSKIVFPDVLRHFLIIDG
jgi:hypothetical protein|nr:MAG TPA: hypothetical protein [Caudoviricetes sp.]